MNFNTNHTTNDSVAPKRTTKFALTAISAGCLSSVPEVYSAGYLSSVTENLHQDGDKTTVSIQEEMSQTKDIANTLIKDIMLETEGGNDPLLPRGTKKLINELRKKVEPNTRSMNGELNEPNVEHFQRVLGDLADLLKNIKDADQRDKGKLISRATETLRKVQYQQVKEAEARGDEKIYSIDGLFLHQQQLNELRLVHLAERVLTGVEYRLHYCPPALAWLVHNLAEDIGNAKSVYDLPDHAFKLMKKIADTQLPSKEIAANNRLSDLKNDIIKLMSHLSAKHNPRDINDKLRPTINATIASLNKIKNDRSTKKDQTPIHPEAIAKTQEKQIPTQRSLSDSFKGIVSFAGKCALAAAGLYAASAVLNYNGYNDLNSVKDAVVSKVGAAKEAMPSCESMGYKSETCENIRGACENIRGAFSQYVGGAFLPYADFTKVEDAMSSGDQDSGMCVVVNTPCEVVFGGDSKVCHLKNKIAETASTLRGRIAETASTFLADTFETIADYDIPAKTFNLADTLYKATDPTDQIETLFNQNWGLI